MIELSRLRESERYAARSDEVTAHPPPGSPRQPQVLPLCLRRERKHLPLYTRGRKEANSGGLGKKILENLSHASKATIDRLLDGAFIQALGLCDFRHGLAQQVVGVDAPPLGRGADG